MLKTPSSKGQGNEVFFFKVLDTFTCDFTPSGDHPSIDKSEFYISRICKRACYSR